MDPCMSHCSGHTSFPVSLYQGQVTSLQKKRSRNDLAETFRLAETILMQRYGINAPTPPKEEST